MSASLYDTDFVAWVDAQIACLKAGDITTLDRANLLTELELMGGSERAELGNRLEVLLHQLLKWGWQPENRSRGWLGTIAEQRRRLRRLLDRNPSLKPLLPVFLPEAYDDARAAAVIETGMPSAAFPPTCPFSLDEIRAATFLPGPPQDAEGV